MAERIPQSVAYLVVFRAYLASDGKTPATGKTIAITISKNGATSFSNPNAGATNATEMASGFYKFTLDTTDTGAVGPLAWRGAQADINDAGDVLSVAKATNAGFSALPDAAAEASGGLYTRGTGTGQVNQPANGMIDGNVVRWLGTAASTPTVAGVPNVNVKTWNDLTTVELPLVPTTAGRKLDVSTGGEAGLDWANVGSPTTTVDLSGTTIKTTQKVDVDTIKTNPVVNAGTVTFPTSATLASTTNITAASGVALSAASVQAIWDALTSALTTVGSIGKRLVDYITGDIYARLGAPAAASVSADVAAVKTDSAAIKTRERD